jgi:hypothetical protein
MSRDVLYYKDLITSQYRDKPKFMVWLETAIQRLHDGSTTADDLNSVFNIDQAIGEQLDIVGLLLGRARTVEFNPIQGYSPVLDDETYRLLLKSTIAQNNWKGQITELTEIWSAIFPDGAILVLDNQDMSMRVIVAGFLTSLQRDLVRYGYIIPKPQGVRMTVNYGAVPLFGYGLDNQFITGYQGFWVHEDEISRFGYDLDTDSVKGYDVGYIDS